MIKMLISTYYEGNRYKKGEISDVDSDTEKRWVRNHIAEFLVSEGKTEYGNMTDEQLAEYAALNDIDISRCRSRSGVISKIEKSKGR